MTDMTDPRVTEFREAYNATRMGLSGPKGSHERYRQSLLPYVECIAEMAAEGPAIVRKTMMAALYQDTGLPLGVIAFGFKATTEELEYVSEHPPLEPEPVDEQARLAALPYGLYLKTPHWRAVRAAALKRAEGACALCNTQVGPLEVHHRTYTRKGAERPADVIVLCSQCHGTHHGKLRQAA